MNGNNTLCKCHEKSPPTPLIEKSSQREAQTPRWPREVWQNAGMKQWQAIDSHTKTCSTKDQWAIHNDAWHLHGLGPRDSVDALTFDVVTANNESKSSGTLNVSVLFGGYVIHWQRMRLRPKANECSPEDFLRRVKLLVKRHGLRLMYDARDEITEA